MTKQTQGAKGLFDLHFHIIVHHRSNSRDELKKGMNLKAKADVEVLEDYCLLGCSS